MKKKANCCLCGNKEKKKKNGSVLHLSNAKDIFVITPLTSTPPRPQLRLDFDDQAI